MKRKTTSHHHPEQGRSAEQAQQQLQLFKKALESLTYPFYVVDASDYTVLLDNSHEGLQPAQAGRKCYQIVHKTDRPCSESGERCPLEIVRETQQPAIVEHLHYDVFGKARHFEVHGYPVFDGDNNVVSIIEYSLDITERKTAEQRQQFATQVLDLLNQSTRETDTIRDILFLIKKFTGFEAVGIRLNEGDDFPYYETIGFPATFIDQENYLCAKDHERETIHDSDGHPVLECMCGNVILGRTDPSKPFFTEGGSFWSNGTTQLLATTTEQDRQSRTRNICNASGYESVALIPLRSNSECIGLLQLNDSRQNMFTLDLIEFFEGLGASVGIALSHQRGEESVKKARDELEVRVRQRTAELVDANEKLRQEIAEHRRTEEILRKTARALKVLSECNQALVRAKDEADLLREVCQVIVGIGRYRLVWVGFAEHDAMRTVRPVSQAGFEDGYLQTLDISWADVDRGRGPTGTAIRTGKPSIAKDIMTDPRFAPWRAEASKRGYASSISLPLRSGERVFGALNIYAAEPDAFDADEVALLLELADDLAFGIMSLQAETERQSVQRALGETEARYRELVEGTDNLVIQVDSKGRITFTNSTARKIFALAPEDCVGLTLSELIHPDDRPQTEEALRQWTKSNAPSVTLENRVLSRSGKLSDMLWTISFHRDDGGRLSSINCIARDISDRKRAEEALHYRLRFEELIANLSTSFINLKADEIEDGIDRALKDIGEFARADRSYIFEFSTDGETMNNSHEWCAESISPQVDTLRNLPTRHFPWSMTRLRRFQTIPITRIDDLPPEAAAEKETFEEQNIKSLILVPMIYGGSLLGFVGFDSVRNERSWDDNIITLLKIVGEMFVSAITRSRAERELRAANQQLIADRQSLQDKNIAMREILASFEEEKQVTRQQVSLNIEESVLPLLQRIKEQSRASERQLADLLEQYLREIASPFMDKLKTDFSRLTPRELEICQMIKVGRRSKEMATILNVSLLTIHKHREQIRKKLGLKNSNVNLNSYLQSVD